MKTQVLELIKQFFGKALTYIAARYIRKFQPRIIVIAGSIGKTSTTQAIRTVLKDNFNLRATYANYNTATGVPLSILGERFPVTRMGWITLLPRMWQRSRKKQDFELLVLEIGTDHPGELAQFAYLQPELGIITAIAPEHMENFGSLEHVVAEEFSIGSFCKRMVINRDMVKPNFITKYAPVNTQLVGKETEYSIVDISGNTVSLTLGPLKLRNVQTQLVGTHSLYNLLIAGSVGQLLNISEKAIRSGLQRIEPIPGRMSLLEGKNHSKLIDDTYNSSPDAAIAALDTLYAMSGKQRIALLGSMNELGKTAPLAHRNLGSHCDPNKLDLVVTLGDHANKYIAPAARKRGCEVLEASSPYEAATLIQDRLKSHALILAKGSQNGVFAEETVKQLLKHPTDSKRLVRQTPYWLAVKRMAFEDYPSK